VRPAATTSSTCVPIEPVEPRTRTSRGSSVIFPVVVVIAAILPVLCDDVAPQGR